ncbi:MAG: hypothetical protein V3W04_09520 [Gammaproteobacteria bacterium]
MSQSNMLVQTAFKFASRLKDAGMPDTQIEALTEGLADMLDSNIASKQDIADVRRDIAELRAESKRDIAELRAESKRGTEELRAESKRDIAELRVELKHDIANVQRDIADMGKNLTLRLGTTIVVTAGLLATLIKFFN